MLLLCLAMPLLVIPPLARYSGILDALGLTCDAEEKAAFLEFPQYGGKLVGKDIEGPLGGEVGNFPRCKRLRRGAICLWWPGMHPWSRSLLTTRRSSPSMGGR